MLIRNILKKLKNPDWPTVVLEFVLIVLGIFLALQADNWNENRKNKNDAQLFITRLHQDILLAEKLTMRLRERRLELLQSLISVADTLYGRSDRNEISDKECFAIGASAFFNINISELPALAELMTTGRMAIISQDELRAALVGLQQIKQTLELLLKTHLESARELPIIYPDLVKTQSYVQKDTNEVRLRFDCDLRKMRLNQGFLNDLAWNVDTYDVYFRDGLGPWFNQFDEAHQQVDQALGIKHH